MPDISIILQGNLKEAAGSERLFVSAKTAKEAVTKIKKRLGSKFGAQLCEGADIKSHYIFLLNGLVIDSGRLDKVRLKDGDSLHIYVPVGGG